MAGYLQESKTINGSTATEQLIKAALQDPNNPEPLYGLGYLHMQNGIRTKNTRELELAERYLITVLAQFPGNQNTLQALYNIYYDNILRSRSPDALGKATSIFMQLPDSVRSVSNPPSLAKFAAVAAEQERLHQPDRQMLREILLQAIHESPQTDNSYIQLAHLYREDRYFALAIATLKLGAENIQNSAALYRAIAEAYNKRAEVNGCNYEHVSDIQNAGKYYQLAIPLSPEDQTLHFALSESFFDQNLYQLGLNEVQIASDLKPSGESIGLAAQNFSVFGYHQQALALLQTAVAQGYNLGNAGHHEIYMNLGDWKNAAVGFNQYVQNRNKFSVYDLIKSDMIADQAKLSPWLNPGRISASTLWEKALLDYWSSSISADKLKNMANTHCEKTEYFFYTGYRDLQAGKTNQATAKFNAAIQQDTYRFIERPLARYFLQRYGTTE